MGKKLLIIGASGELGNQIVANSSGWDVYATYYLNKLDPGNMKSFRLDITDKNEVYNLITELKPQVVINCAVSDRSIKNMEKEKDKKMAVVNCAINIAEACNMIGCRTIFISTDLVFDGKRGNYSESDVPNPLIPYGKYKAEMEMELLSLGYNLAIIRTSLIITLEPMGHQVSWIVNSIKNNMELNLFTDEYRSPIFGEDLANAVLDLAETDYRGLINIAGANVNRYELGCAIANHFGLDTNLLKPVEAQKVDIMRPLNCTLDSSIATDILDTNIKALGEIFIQ